MAQGDQIGCLDEWDLCLAWLDRTNTKHHLGLWRDRDSLAGRAHVEPIARFIDRSEIQAIRNVESTVGRNYGLIQPFRRRGLEYHICCIPKRFLGAQANRWIKSQPEKRSFKTLMDRPYHGDSQVSCDLCTRECEDRGGVDECNVEVACSRPHSELLDPTYVRADIIERHHARDV